MSLHTVMPGDTVFSIASRYGITTEQLISVNGLEENTVLVPGQVLVILIPERVYTVREGDTLTGIAREQNVTVSSLRRSNPFLMGGSDIQPGQVLTVTYRDAEEKSPLRVNGYAYPFIQQDTLIRTLPFLSSLTVFTYGFTPEGALIEPADERIIAEARAGGVSPLMLLSTLTEEGKFSNELSHILLSDPTLQEQLLAQILRVLTEKNYSGLDIDFEYVFPEDRIPYADFVKRAHDLLAPRGYTVLVALAPKTSVDQPGLLYEAHDYKLLGEAADGALLMTYEWGYTYGPPMAVAPLNKVAQVVDFALTQLPPDRLLLGIPNYGYDWKLPFVMGESKAESLSNTEAVLRAGRYGTEILYDEEAASPYYYYTDEDGASHVVWFEDARSIRAKLELAIANGLSGVSFWNIMRYFPAGYQVLGALINILRL